MQEAFIGKRHFQKAFNVLQLLSLAKKHKLSLRPWIPGDCTHLALAALAKVYSRLLE